MLALRNHGGVPTLSLARGLDGLFDGLFEGHIEGGGATATAWAPAVNVYEDAEQYVVEAEVPGFTLEQIEVLVEGDELTLAGTREIPAPAGGTVHRRERPAGEFRRGFTLPVAIAADRVQASLRDGVLQVTLPKAEAARSRKIAVARG